MLSSLTFVFVIYTVIELVLLGLGCAVGFLLHWVLPEVDLGTALLIGLVATGFTIYFFARLSATLKAYEVNEDENEEGPPITLFAIQPPRTTRRRRKKS